MSKKKSWYARVKDFLFPEKDDQTEQLKNKKKKKKRLFGLMRTRKEPPSSAAPILSRERTEINVRPQIAHQNLLVPGPATSEKVVATTTTTTTSSSSSRQCEEYSASKILPCRAQLVQHVEHLAAIKIQTAFRCYLARKALRALRGLVRLQAMIRGRAVRRQAVATLKSLQSIVNIQSQTCATRYQKANQNKHNEDTRHLKLKIEQSSQRRRDGTLLTMNQENAILLSKTEAMLRRNKLEVYSFNHRHSADTEDGRTIVRLRRWLEERDEDEVPTKEDIKRIDTIRLRNKQPPLMLTPRSSFEPKKSRQKFQAKPAYMAATESARARARLVRPMQLESYSDGDSPYKRKISPTSSVNSERNCGCGLVASGSYNRQRFNAGFKGIGGSMKFNRNGMDYLGVQNGRWLLNLD